MDPRLKAFCDVLTEACDTSNDADSISNQCWAIVTALRGPDVVEFILPDGTILDDITVKLATTCVIRAKLLPRAARSGGTSGALVEYDSSELLATRLRLGEGGRTRFDNHFLNHVRYAFNALGLSWDAVNPKE